MPDRDKAKIGWKKRMSRELTEYAINVAYLAFVFAAFNCYRRLILAEHRIVFLDYGIAVIEALILGKVIMIGNLMHIGRRFEDRPLIVPAFFRCIIFSIWVGLFKAAEFCVVWLLAGKNPLRAFDSVVRQEIYEILAWCLMVVSAFVPFFSIKLLGQVMGEGRLFELFFRSRRV